MHVRRIQPTRSLRDIVESIWLQDNALCVNDSRTPSCVVPTGTVEILFHYGDRFSHIEPNGITMVPRSYVTGQRSRPVYPLPTGRVGIVLVSLFPWGLNALFAECANTPDGYVDLALILGRSRIAELEERLLAAKDAARRIHLVESFLISQRADAASRPPGGRAGQDHRMVAATRLLASTTTPRPVHEAAQQLSMSRRHFARVFKSTIGLPPKTFSRIMRLQKALRLHRCGNESWTNIAAECGYSDQAHLTHEVKHFTARTPKGVEIQRPGADDFFNGNSVSKFFNTIYL